MSRTDTLSLQLDEQYMMGVTRHIPDYKLEHLDYNLATCIPAGWNYGWKMLKNYVGDLKYVASAEGAKSVGSFITIGNIFPATWDWQQFWMLTALISIMFVPTVRFSYLNRRIVRLYSSLGIGYGICAERTKEPDGKVLERNNEAFCPVQFTPHRHQRRSSSVRLCGMYRRLAGLF